MNKHRFSLLGLLCLAAPALAGDEWSIDWYTIDAGGVMSSTGGDFELSGTIGQWDATEARQLSGGQWKLTGGFWSLTLEELADLLFSDRLEDE